MVIGITAGQSLTNPLYDDTERSRHAEPHDTNGWDTFNALCKRVSLSAHSAQLSDLISDSTRYLQTFVAANRILYRVYYHSLYHENCTQIETFFPRRTTGPCGIIHFGWFKLTINTGPFRKIFASKRCHRTAQFKSPTRIDLELSRSSHDDSRGGFSAVW